MSLFAYVAAGTAWMVLHVVIFMARFGEIPVTGLVQALWFAPTGAFALFIVTYLGRRARSAAHRRWVVGGVLVALPLALFGNVIGGLLGPVGVTVFGVGPLAAGAGIGYGLGMSATREDD